MCYTAVPQEIRNRTEEAFLVFREGLLWWSGVERFGLDDKMFSYKPLEDKSLYWWW